MIQCKKAFLSLLLLLSCICDVGEPGGNTVFCVPPEYWYNVLLYQFNVLLCSSQLLGSQFPVSPPGGKRKTGCRVQHTERVYFTINKGGLAVIQTAGPVCIHPPRDRFPSLEVRMNPHKQGPSPQSCPRLRLVLTHVTAC